jgi:hypothetical protein
VTELHISRACNGISTKVAQEENYKASAQEVAEED